MEFNFGLNLECPFVLTKFMGFYLTGTDLERFNKNFVQAYGANQTIV